MKKGFLIFGCALIVLASCKKDDKGCNKDMASIAGKYKLTASTTKTVSTGAIEDNYATSSACQKNSVGTYNSNGTWTSVDGCDVADNEDGIWSVSGDSLYLDGQGYKIQSFDCKNLSLASQTSFFGETYIYSLTLAKQ